MDDPFAAIDREDDFSFRIHDPTSRPKIRGVQLPFLAPLTIRIALLMTIWKGFQSIYQLCDNVCVEFFSTRCVDGIPLLVVLIGNSP